MAALHGQPYSATVCSASESCVCAVLCDASGVALPAQLEAHLLSFRASYVQPSQALHLKHLEHVADLGAGQYGTVLLMRDRRDDTPVALKLMRRDAVVKARQCKHVLSEKQLLVELRHPFIVRLLATFKDSLHLMMAMEFVSGGELYSLLMARSCLAEPDCRFVGASVLLRLLTHSVDQPIYRALNDSFALLLLTSLTLHAFDQPI